MKITNDYIKAADYVDEMLLRAWLGQGRWDAIHWHASVFMHEDDLSRAKSIIKDFKATSFERNSAFHEMIILGVIGGIFLVSSLGAFIATCLPGCAVGAFYLSGALLGFAGAATLTICRVQYNNFSSMETQYETAKTKCAVERAKFFDDVAGVTELNKDNNNSFRRFINNSKQFGVQLGNNIPMRFLD